MPRAEARPVPDLRVRKPVRAMAMAATGAVAADKENADVPEMPMKLLYILRGAATGAANKAQLSKDLPRLPRGVVRVKKEYRTQIRPLFPLRGLAVVEMLY